MLLVSATNINPLDLLPGTKHISDLLTDNRTKSLVENYIQEFGTTYDKEQLKVWKMAYRFKLYFYVR